MKPFSKKNLPPATRLSQKYLFKRFGIWPRREENNKCFWVLAGTVAGKCNVFPKGLLESWPNTNCCSNISKSAPNRSNVHWMADFGSSVNQAVLVLSIHDLMFYFMKISSVLVSSYVLLCASHQILLIFSLFVFSSLQLDGCC